MLQTTKYVMKKWFCYYLIILPLLLQTGCIRQDEPDCSEDHVELKIDWSGVTAQQPDGKWLVVYPEDVSVKPFSIELIKDDVNDPLPNKNYRALLLAMNKEFVSIDFQEMERLERATVVLKKPADDDHYAHTEMIYSVCVEVKRARRGSRTLLLKPKPLAMKATFVMKCPGVSQVHAHLTGIPVVLNLSDQTVVYGDEQQYLGLNTAYANNEVTLSGNLLLPTTAAEATRADLGVSLQLDINLFYEDGTTEDLKVDVTQAMNAVASGDIPSGEVVFELKKIGVTAVVADWKVGTGEGVID